jgi:hypothetical protein
MLPLTLVPRITAAFFASCLPSKREGLVAMRSSFRESAMILACLRFFGAATHKKVAEFSHAWGVKSLGKQAFSLGWRCIFLLRRSESPAILLRCGIAFGDAAALPGRFLPELGRSLGSGLFVLGPVFSSFGARCARTSG